MILSETVGALQFLWMNKIWRLATQHNTEPTANPWQWHDV